MENRLKQIEEAAAKEFGLKGEEYKKDYFIMGAEWAMSWRDKADQVLLIDINKLVRVLESKHNELNKWCSLADELAEALKKYADAVVVHGRVIFGDKTLRVDEVAPIEFSHYADVALAKYEAAKRGE